MAGENWTFWFNMTNLALGMITVLAVLVVMGAVGWDVIAAWLRKPQVNNFDIEAVKADLRSMWQNEPHTLAVPEFGLTMADGGEKIAPAKSKKKSPRK